MTKIIKVITIIISTFILTACYDYKEVNNIDIITGIGIDYQDEEYIVTLEVLKNTGDKTAIKLDTDIISGKGQSLANALFNAANNLNKSPNYSHLKVVVLTKDALKTKWFSTMDFFLRNTDFRENFYVITTSDTPTDIFNTKDSTTKVTSIVIANYFENQKYNTVSKKFEDYASDYLTFNKSLLFTNIEITNNKLTLNGATIFDNQIYDLSKNDIKLLNDVKTTLDELNKDYKLLLTHIGNDTFPYSKLIEEVQNLSNRLIVIEDRLDNSLNAIGSMKDDESRAHQQLEEIKVILKDAKYKIREYDFPTIPDSYYVESKEATDAIKEIMKELNRKPINIATLNTRVDTARDLVLKLYARTKEMVKNARLAETAIVYGNRYRAIDDNLDKYLQTAELLFFKGDYNKSLEITLNALNKIDSGAMDRLMTIYNNQLER